jgi:hypothetical protein
VAREAIEAAAAVVMQRCRARRLRHFVRRVVSAVLERALLVLEVCVIEVTSPRSLELKRQLLDPLHEPHELRSVPV